jgi:hypothetical protein
MAVVQEAFDALGLYRLPTEWVELVWSNNFIDTAGEHPLFPRRTQLSLVVCLYFHHLDAKIGVCVPSLIFCGTNSVLRACCVLPHHLADSWPLDELPGPDDVITGLTQLASGLVEWRSRPGE